MNELREKKLFDKTESVNHSGHDCTLRVAIVYIICEIFNLIRLSLRFY